MSDFKSKVKSITSKAQDLDRKVFSQIKGKTKILKTPKKIVSFLIFALVALFLSEILLKYIWAVMMEHIIITFGLLTIIGIICYFSLLDRKFSRKEALINESQMEYEKRYNRYENNNNKFKIESTRKDEREKIQYTPKKIKPVIAKIKTVKKEENNIEPKLEKKIVEELNEETVNRMSREKIQEQVDLLTNRLSSSEFTDLKGNKEERKELDIKNGKVVDFQSLKSNQYTK